MAATPKLTQTAMAANRSSSPNLPWRPHHSEAPPSSLGRRRITDLPQRIISIPTASMGPPGSDYSLLAREPARASPSFSRARAEPIFPARCTNEPARAEPIWSELNAGSDRAQPELARVQP
jgi:hypothetical protein